MSFRVKKHVHNIHEHQMLTLGARHTHTHHSLVKRYCFYFKSDKGAMILLSQKDSTLLKYHVKRAPASVDTLQQELLCAKWTARPPYRVHTVHMPSVYPRHCMDKDTKCTEDLIVKPAHLRQLIQQLNGHASSGNGKALPMRALLGLT